MANTPVARLRAVERHLAWHAETDDPYQEVVIAASLDAALVANKNDVERVAEALYELDKPSSGYTAALRDSWTGDDEFGRDMRREEYLEQARAAMEAMGFAMPETGP